MQQTSYTPTNPPTKGNAKLIWDTLISGGFVVDELHYNKGPRSDCGSGTWACEAYKQGVCSCVDNEWGYWCGIVGKTAVYIMQTSAPYGEYFVGFSSRVCPFLQYQKNCNRPGKHQICKYASMKPSRHGENIWPEGCPKECDAGTDEFLILRNNEYEKWKVK
jgi:hypothetical protein